MTPHLAAVLNTEAPSSELLELVLMVAESSWQAKEHVAAKRAAQLALQIDPRNQEALLRLGRTALVERDYETAAVNFSGLLRAPASLVNLAIAYSGLKYFDLSVYYCEQALAMQPDFLPAHIHLAAVLEETGQLGRAEAAVVQAIELLPGNPNLLYALALYQLQRGDFENGWTNYEQRPPRLELARKLDEYREWQGEDLEGKTILVCGEQGLGDQIMFARYIPLLQSLGANVVFFMMPELARLFAGPFSGVRILASDAELKGLEPDYWIALGSMPLRWGGTGIDGMILVGTPGTGGFQLPYLWADREDTNRFASIVKPNGRLRVGLCWKGNPQHRRDAYRSMPFENLKPILELSGIDFYSLQQGDTDSGLVNLTAYCHDVADTAAAIANLDLVITVDTAMLHLAGAMGKPVWGLIYTPGDWRWGSGTATPWYSSARLIRQQTQLDWSGEIAAMAFDLQAATADHCHPVDRLPWHVPGAIKAWGEQIEENGRITRLCRYGTMTWLRNDHYIGRALDLYGEYSESEVALLRRLIKQGDTVIEAGANVGGLTVPMGQMVGLEGAIYAFEPQPAYFQCLSTNLLRNTVAKRSSMALGAESKMITLRAVEEEKIHAPGWPSTGPEFEVEQVTVDALALDACHLIKIDVDGMEHDILRGAEETIDRHRPLIYVEHDKPADYPEMLPWLAAKGYRLYRHAAPLFNPANYRGNPVNVFGSLISLMVLAVPNERKDLHPCDWGLERIPVTKE